MKVTIWGSRGSVASAGPETIRYGGNTACVQVTGQDGTTLVLDAGTGLRRLGSALVDTPGCIHILLTHLHMDHIQGLGFFRPFFQPGREIQIWGPASTTLDLRTRLSRYLSPPLFPVRIRDLPSRLQLHDVGTESWRIGAFTVAAAGVIHPGPTVGCRIAEGDVSMAYIPDHEPALGGLRGEPAWTSGYGLADGVDLLIHDAQYTSEEYEERVGWGHSTPDHAVRLADLAGARRLALFHHDPDHDDTTLDRLLDDARAISHGTEVIAGREGLTLDL